MVGRLRLLDWSLLGLGRLWLRASDFRAVFDGVFNYMAVCGVEIDARVDGLRAEVFLGVLERRQHERARIRDRQRQRHRDAREVALNTPQGKISSPFGAKRRSRHGRR